MLLILNEQMNTNASLIIVFQKRRLDIFTIVSCFFFMVDSQFLSSTTFSSAEFQGAPSSRIPVLGASTSCSSLLRRVMGFSRPKKEKQIDDRRGLEIGKTPNRAVCLCNHWGGAKKEPVVITAFNSEKPKYPNAAVKRLRYWYIVWITVSNCL